MKDAQSLINRDKTLTDQVVREVLVEKATFQNAVLPFAREENEQALSSHILGFYQAISTDSKLRDASTAAETKMDEHGIEASMREDVFQLIDTVYKTQKDDQALDPESRHLLAKYYKGYIKMGLKIPAGPERDRFKAIKKRLSELSINFSKNLNEEKGGLWLLPAELEGVPSDVLEGLKTGEKGSENEDRVLMTFKYPDLIPTQKYCKNAETRHKVFIANENKCNVNTPLFREAIILRDEAARLLGYPNFAAYTVEDEMLKNQETVDAFLADLRKRLAPGGLHEIENLKKLKAAETGNADHYFLWDHRYFDTLMLERDFQLDQNLIADYFPLESTIEGMLNIFEKIFGMAFVKLDAQAREALSPTGKGDDIIWHPEVEAFTVWDDEGEGSAFIGYLFLDLFPRDGKYGHAANFNIQPGFIRADGSRRYPATALVCNFSKPTAKKPSLLKHDEVVTLFHELGHGIHDLVSKTTYSRFHGTSTVRTFVEAPSQMLENWIWEPSRIAALSKHWSYLSPEYAEAYKSSASPTAGQPLEKMPDDLISSIVKTKHINAALFNLRQLHFGTFDLFVHEPASHASAESLDISATYNRLRAEISKLDGPEALGEGFDWGHGEATFGHLMGGYQSGYYGYLSSQVYSADMFYTAFKKDPMDPKEGRRYRHTVLERGGSQDELKTLEEFLGRKPDSEAFYKDLGIA